VDPRARNALLVLLDLARQHKAKEIRLATDCKPELLIGKSVHSIDFEALHAFSLFAIHEECASLAGRKDLGPAEESNYKFDVEGHGTWCCSFVLTGTKATLTLSRSPNDGVAEGISPIRPRPTLQDTATAAVRKRDTGDDDEVDA
jgi:hypothetical protein